MGESRLERGLRAAAWTALLATLIALVGAGVLVQRAPAVPGISNGNAAAATSGAPSEENE